MRFPVDVVLLCGRPIEIAGRVIVAGAVPVRRDSFRKGPRSVKRLANQGADFTKKPLRLAFSETDLVVAVLSFPRRKNVPCAGVSNAPKRTCLVGGSLRYRFPNFHRQRLRLETTRPIRRTCRASYFTLSRKGQKPRRRSSSLPVHRPRRRSSRTTFRGRHRRRLRQCDHRRPSSGNRTD